MKIWKYEHDHYDGWQLQGPYPYSPLDKNKTHNFVAESDFAKLEKENEQLENALEAVNVKAESLQLLSESYRTILAKIQEAYERDWPEQLADGMFEAREVLEKKNG